LTLDAHQDGAAAPPIRELLAFERRLADLSAQFVNLPADDSPNILNASSCFTAEIEVPRPARRR
jgi:hypothetical protein